LPERLPTNSCDTHLHVFGDAKAGTIQPVGESKTPATPTVWLPTERVAKAWLAVVTGKPFDP
jgi:hypothetical protein